jgi:hypothetical protein
VGDERRRVASAMLLEEEHEHRKTRSHTPNALEVERKQPKLAAIRVKTQTDQGTVGRCLLRGL